jgi:hypothetical protein
MPKKWTINKPESNARKKRKLICRRWPKEVCGVQVWNDKDMDSVWSGAVKAKAKFKCERDPKHGTTILESHHVVSRRHKTTRHELRNGVCLCFNCHFKAHSDPKEFREWFEQYRGVEEFLWLEKLSRFNSRQVIYDVD